MMLLTVAIAVVIALGVGLYWLYTLIAKCESRIQALESSPVKAPEPVVNGSHSEPNRLDEWVSNRRDPTPVDEGGDSGSEEDIDPAPVEDGVSSEAGSTDS